MIIYCMSISILPGPNISPSKGSKIWTEFLNTTNLLQKKGTDFPKVKACRLRVTYSKLQESHPYPEPSLEINAVRRTKASLLLDHDSGGRSRDRSLNGYAGREVETIQPKSQYRREKNIRFNNIVGGTENKDMSIIFDGDAQFLRTIHVPQVRRFGNIAGRREHSMFSKSDDLRKSQQFSEYFKRVVITQKINNELHKLFSEGKGLDISNRIHFEQQERMKLTMMNQKMEEKQKNFRCASTKLNKYEIIQKQVQFPSLKSQKKSEKYQNPAQNQQSQSSKPPIPQNKIKNCGSLICQPWQIETDPQENDIQQ